MSGSKNIVAFLLQHVRDEQEETSKVIGIYSTLGYAEEAKRRLSIQNGFKDYAEGFSIDEYVINKDHWSEGFLDL